MDVPPRGDLPLRPYYADDSVTIYHGDCRDVLPELPNESIDLLLTDPPYGMQYASVGKTAQHANVSADGVRQGVRVVRQSLHETAAKLKPDAHLLIFCHWQSWPDFYDAASAYATIRNALIWHKGGGGMGNVLANYIRDYEVILYAARGNRNIGGDGKYSSVLSGFDREPGMGRFHPTQKPVPLLSHLIRRHSDQGGMVLDSFMGSGSTLLAARAQGRRAIGIELDERYCDIAARRLTAETQESMGLDAA